MKKTLSLLLALLMLLPAFAACGESKENTDTPANTPADTQTTDTPGAQEEAETESPTAHWDAVAKPDLGGMDIIATTNYFDSNSAANPEGALYDMSLATESSQKLWKEYRQTVADFNAAQSDVIALAGRSTPSKTST